MKHFFFFVQRIMRTKSTNPTPPAPGRAGDTGKRGGKIREHFLSAVWGYTLSWNHYVFLMCEGAHLTHQRKVLSRFQSMDLEKSFDILTQKFTLHSLGTSS